MRPLLITGIIKKWPSINTVAVLNDIYLDLLFVFADRFQPIGGIWRAIAGLHLCLGWSEWNIIDVHIGGKDIGRFQVGLERISTKLQTKQKR